MSIYETLQTGQQMSQTLAEQTAHVASTYPRTEGATELVETLNTVVDLAEGPDPSHRLTAAVVLGRVVGPYILQRAQEIDVRDPASVADGATQVVRDMRLMRNLYASTSDLALSSLKGDAPTKPASEIAEQVFRGGPLIAKMGQSLPGIVKDKTDDRSAFIRNVGRHMQEGVSMPQEDELPALAKTVPPELTLDGVVSSASVAHILRVKDQVGTVLAQKVPRPGFDQAMTDNVRAYVVASDVADSFMRHNKPEATTAEFDRVRQVLPFLLTILEQDIRGELDFEHEAAMQTRARQALAGSPVRVPKVLAQHTTSQRIVMEYMPAERIEDASADPRYLKNLGTMCVRLWKHGLMHGDMHPGNVKAAPDGSGEIVAYDWGRTVERQPGMIKNLGSFLWGFARKNPSAIAKAYHTIQSPIHQQVSMQEAHAAAEDVVATIKERRASSPHRGVTRWMRETNGALQQFAITMGVRHQSTISTDYMAIMRSAASLGTLAKGVLQKPEYGSTRHKIMLSVGVLKAVVKEAFRPRL